MNFSAFRLIIKRVLLPLHFYKGFTCMYWYHITSLLMCEKYCLQLLSMTIEYSFASTSIWLTFPFWPLKTVLKTLLRGWRFFDFRKQNLGSPPLWIGKIWVTPPPHSTIYTSFFFHNIPVYVIWPYLSYIRVFLLLIFGKIWAPPL